MLQGEAVDIVDYITARIEKLKMVNKVVREKGLTDERLEGKIFELDELRMWISANYF